jgi:hypothetical protein
MTLEPTGGGMNMVERLPKSKHGEGVGGPVQECVDPDSPSFDPATHETSTDKKIRMLLSEDIIGKLTAWERSFLLDVYGVAPLNRKRHITVWKIWKRMTQPEPEVEEHK